jgi:hypothetical protein
MEYSNAELTQHILELESLVMDMLSEASQRNLGLLRARGHICVNNALHNFSPLRPEDMKEHPPGLNVPHYCYDPMTDWSRTRIHLHPLNVPR